MYLTNTKTYICFVVNTLSQYLVEPIHVHLLASKHVMIYLKGAFNYGICYTRDHDFRLYGYIDSYWVGSASDRKRTSRCCFHFSAMTSWKIKDSIFSLSMTEVEYIGTCSTSCEAIWIQKFFSGLFDLDMEATMILCDHQSFINMTKNPMFHDKMKHIEIRCHYIHDMVQKGAIKLQYVGRYEQVAYVLTKPLSHVKFENF
jgi:hypothetical protein